MLSVLCIKCLIIGSARKFLSFLMATKTNKQKQSKDPAEFKHLTRVLAKRGITVRREKLCRDTSFRVKSGKCLFSGEDIIFVDQRLPDNQQVAVLVDHLVSAKLELGNDELIDLSPATRALLSLRA